MIFSAALKIQIGSAAPYIIFFTDYDTGQSNPNDWHSFNISTDMGISAALLFDLFLGETGWFSYLPSPMRQVESDSFTIIGDIVDIYGNSEEYLAAEIDLRAYKAEQIKAALKKFIQQKIDYGVRFPIGSNPQNVVDNIEATPIEQVQDLIELQGLSDMLVVKNTPTRIKFMPCTKAELSDLDDLSLDLVAKHQDGYLSIIKMINFENANIEAAGWSKVKVKSEESPSLGEYIEYMTNCTFTLYDLPELNPT